jgi:hypothetical protein
VREKKTHLSWSSDRLHGSSSRDRSARLKHHRFDVRPGDLLLRERLLHVRPLWLHVGLLRLSVRLLRLLYKSPLLSGISISRYWNIFKNTK